MVKKLATLTLCDDIIIYSHGKFLFFKLCVRSISINSVSSKVCSMIGRMYNSIDIKILRKPSQPLSMKILRTICILESGTIFPSMGRIHPMAKMPRSISYFSTYVKESVRDGDRDHSNGILKPVSNWQ